MKNIGRCSYHLHKDRKNVRLYKCKYCGKGFCKLHLRPKPVGMPGFKSESMRDRLFREEYRSEEGHPCFPFSQKWEDEKEKEIENYSVALDKLNTSKPVFSRSQNSFKIEKQNLDKEISFPYSSVKRSNPKKSVEIKPTQSDNPKIKSWLNTKILFGIIALIILIIALASILITNKTPEQPQINKTIYENISFSNYLNDLRGSNGQNVTLHGFLKRSIEGGGNNGAVIVSIVDDSNKGIKLDYQIAELNSILPDIGQTKTLFIVGGVLRWENNGLTMKVGTIAPYQRTQTEEVIITTKNQTIQMRFKLLEYISKLLNRLFGEVNTIFKIKLNCSDGTFYDQCSTEKPYYCFNGTIIKNSTECGCPKDYRIKGNDCELIPRCSDRTIYGECSKEKPLLCLDGRLINKASKCGCSGEDVINGDICVSKYMTNPKTIHLGSFNYVVYGGVNDYLSRLDRSISYYYVSPTNRDFIIRDLDNKLQRTYLLPFVQKIQEQSTNKQKQAEIAIQIVQGIPYDWDAFNTNSVSGRYPYEVLYDMKGVCMEKADLLAFTLRELGFGVVIFEFQQESHRAVGIKCNKGNYNTNYCFIESTDYYPIGQIPYTYVGGVDIRNAIPEVIVISDGDSFKI